MVESSITYIIKVYDKPQPVNQIDCYKKALNIKLNRKIPRRSRWNTRLGKISDRRKNR
jgi:hypothetical protein